MKKFLSMLLIAVMVLGLVACGKKPEETPAGSDEPTTDAPGTLDSEYIKTKGTLVVGITDFAPMDYKEEGSDEWIGFDADMAKAFAEYLGVKAEFIEIDWDNKLLELNNKSIDCVWNGMTLTEEVTTTMACGKAYCNNAQVVVLKKDVAEKYADKEACKELNFAVENGSAGEEAATAEGFNFTAVQTQADALMEVAAGTSDACIIDLLMAGAMIGEGTSYPDLTYTAELTSEEYGCGFRQDGDMAEQYDAFYKEAFESGKVMEIAEKYGVQESIIEAK